MKNFSGLSFTVVFGRYGGFSVYASSQYWRVVLGWMAIAIYFSDIEAFMEYLVNKNKKG